jgi:hypothetical protein
MEDNDDNLVDPFEPIDNHPDHKKFYLDGIEDSSGEIATAVEDAIRDQHDVDDSDDVFVDTVEIDAAEKRFKVGAAIIEEQPIEYAPFGVGVKPNAAENDDVRHSVVDGEHYLWSEPNEDAPTLANFGTRTTNAERAEVTNADLRDNEADHRTPQEQLNDQFTNTVIETNADGCDLYVSWDKDTDPAIDEIDLPEGWDVCGRVGDPSGLEFISPDTKVYACGFMSEETARDAASESPDYHYSNVDGHHHIWSEEKIVTYSGAWTPRERFGMTITPAVLRENLEK